MLVKTGISIVMNTDRNFPKIVFESAFIEEAVFLAAKYNINKINDTMIQEFHKAREKIYQAPTDEKRNSAFEHLYREYFNKFKINEVFERIIAGFPLFYQPHVMFFIKKVWSKGQEDAELFVDGDLKTVCIALMANRLLQPFYIQAMLRHDLLRVSDMLDPLFRYTPHILLAGKNELENNLIKDRFRVLWDLYIDARLRRNGHPVVKPAEDQKKEFQKAFFFLKSSEQDYVYSRLEGGEDLIQIDLMNWAQDARGIRTLGEGGLRCPLCNFTCYESVKNWSSGTGVVVKEIEKDHPEWGPAQGICPQCLDLYRCRAEVKV